MPAEKRPRRSDALRNRDKLLSTAVELLSARGLDVPMDEVARQAGVSIGTLYNHFPTRQDLYDAILPGRLAAFEKIAETALAEEDPWRAFTGYLDDLFSMQAGDRGLNDTMSRRYFLSDEVDEICRRGFDQAVLIFERAKAAGRLRPDFEAQDLAMLVWAVSQLIRESADWRRFLDLHIGGLRVGD
ncbi:TetR/AcrR family transcriptional regulator [Salininema proteolyticum]|uniref:TetR/AcrR family transcriptional regulator n=1 Tax=Salininema proteolyticum TaxID=1607685 RepID=A0ABV8TTJ8_9ACTN